MHATTSRKRVKPARTIRVAVPPFGDCPEAIVVITVGKEAVHYYVRPIPSDFGTAFRVEKLPLYGYGVYHVNLGGDGASPSCECKGFLRWNKPCKHISGLQALKNAGQL